MNSNLTRPLQELPTNSTLQKMEFHMLPLVNVDGYIYSMTPTSDTKDRLKRKNMADSGCQDQLFNGVDLNRNFPAGFNLTSDCLYRSRSGEVERDCLCSNSYQGPHPFSEPETRAARDALSSAVPWIAVDIHGSLGAWLTPPNTRMASPEEKSKPAWDLDFLATFIEEEYGVRYAVSSTSALMGVMGGTMMGWIYEHLGVERTYAVEVTR